MTPPCEFGRGDYRLPPSRAEIQRQDDPRERQPRRQVHRLHGCLILGLEQAHTARLANNKQAAEVANPLPCDRELLARPDLCLLDLRQALACDPRQVAIDKVDTHRRTFSGVPWRTVRLSCASALRL